MALEVDYGPDGSGVAGVADITWPVSILNFSADFAKIEDEPGQVIITDVTAPSDRPTKIRISQRDRANVYAGTSIDSAVFLPNKRGADTLIEVTQIWQVTDTVSGLVVYQFPVRCALSVTAPISEFVSSTELGELVGLTLAAALKEQSADGDVDLAGLEALTHGSLSK